MVITLFLILKTGTQNWTPYQLTGFELRFGNSEQSFLVGYNRFNDNQPMVGWIEYNGQSLL